MTDQNPDHAASTITAPVPAAANSLVNGLLLVGFLLILLSIVSNGYLWHLWRQDQALQQARTQSNPELQTLKIQVQTLSSDLEYMKKALELYQTENAVIRDKMSDEMRNLQENQNAYQSQVQQQLQDHRDQSTQPIPNQQRNKITW